MAIAQRLSRAETIAPRVPELHIEWCEEIEPQLSNLWLIKRTIIQQGVALIYGHPGSGKSFLAIDMAMHVALGWDWQGLKTQKGLVVYIGAEGQSGLRNRIVAFRRHYEITGPTSLALIPHPVDLHDPNADRDAVARAVRRAQERYNEKVALIVVDTISKTFGGGKENTDDMAVYVSNCGWLAAEFDCCVLPIHHRPKDAESQDPRGHSSLKGGVDSIILVEGGKPRKARITKQKDDEERDLLLFNLCPVEIGVEDGEAVTSCIVERALVDTNSMADPFVRAVAKLRDGARLVFEQLSGLLESEGQAIPEDIPDTVIDRTKLAKVACLETWRDKSIAAAGTDAGRKPDSCRRVFNRALEKLTALGIVQVWGEWAWITRPSRDRGGTITGTSAGHRDRRDKGL